MTDTETMTLTDFLHARIAEVEDHARIAQHECSDLTLAECAAKRRIIELHRLVTEDEHSPLTWPPKKVTGCDACRLAGPDGDLRVDDGPCPTLRLLALPYADHEDYRAEWRVA